MPGNMLYRALSVFVLAGSFCCDYLCTRDHKRSMFQQSGSVKDGIEGQSLLLQESLLRVDWQGDNCRVFSM